MLQALNYFTSITCGFREIVCIFKFVCHYRCYILFVLTIYTDEVKHQLTDSKPKVVLTVKGNMDTLSKVMSADDVSVKVFVFTLPHPITVNVLTK